jgi:hypothetical protein
MKEEEEKLETNLIRFFTSKHFINIIKAKITHRTGGD